MGKFINHLREDVQKDAERVHGIATDPIVQGVAFNIAKSTGLLGLAALLGGILFLQYALGWSDAALSYMAVGLVVTLVAAVVGAIVYLVKTKYPIL